ncbi:thermonuclease family protein [Rhizobium sp. SL86]|uniref:thermonuclease family protein n=1 Tax=Rhizobium sp. SL86 TaxID=2995148 RepID=UPI0022747D89|nr:thermonuclease family protein [Rhizobium sp. SL86]MCY1668913.1 thermonuclease family protein [Rhizobium sp. SL86]
MSRLKDLLLTVSFLFLLVLIAARLAGPGEESVFAGPFFVIDGDTLAVGSARLRLSGIDAPELKQTCLDETQRPWACGEEARAALVRLMHETQAECRGEARDRYRRVLVSCVSGGQTVNGRMVASGFALATGALTFRREQSAAETAHRGIWRGPFDHPRVFRDRAGLIDQEQEGEGVWQSIYDLLSLAWL